MNNTRSVWIFCLGLMAHQLAFADIEIAKQALDAGDYVTAEKEFRVHAEEGDANAQYILGRMYEKGNGLVKDEAWAITWYRKAAEQGHALARDTLNRIYAEAGIPSPYLEAAKKPEAQQAPVAQKEPQVIHMPPADAPTEAPKVKVTQVEKMRLMASAMDAQSSGDQEKAAANYQILADAGDASAQSRLAAMYQQGEGVEQDSSKAADLYLQSAQQGNAGAQYQIAKMYQNGEGVEQNADEAFSWYRTAASQGHAAANREFDILIEAAETERLAAAESTETPPEVDEAAEEEVKEKPASKGFFASLFGGNDEPEEEKQPEPEPAIAEPIVVAEKVVEETLEETPLNEPIPLPEANELPQPLPIGQDDETTEQVATIEQEAVQRAAELKTEAVRFQTGDGVDRDLNKAADLYRQSAEQGNADAQFNLANMYLLGEGVQQDDAWAVTWYRKAAAQGHEEAQRNLENLYQAAGIEPEAQIEKIAAAKAEATPVVVAEIKATEEVQAPEPVVVEEPPVQDEPVSLAVAETETTAAPKQRGFFSRLFGGDDEEQQTADVTQPAAEAVEVITEPEPEPEPEPVQEQVEPIQIAEPVVETPAEPAEVTAEPISIASTETSSESSTRKKGFFSSLFGGDDDEEKTEEPVQPAAEPAPEPEPVVAESDAEEAIAEEPVVPVTAVAEAATAAAVSTAVATEEVAETSSAGVGGFFSSLFGGNKEPEPEEVITPAEAEQVLEDSSTQTANLDEPDAQVQESLQRIEEDIVAGVSSAPIAQPEVAAEPGKTLEQARHALERRDYGTALEIFKELAEQGNAAAQAHLGYMYFIGEGVAKNSNEAIYWLTESAKQGDADAQYNLAVAYAFGDGVDQSYTQAVYWYRKSALQGHLKAQYSLAISYTKGEGVAADLVEAVRWYRSAANGGDADAQYYLGYLLQVGAGVEQDRDEALNWFRRAADQGHAAAEEQAANMMSDRSTY